MVEFQNKNSILDAWVEPSADCGSDHNLVIVKFKLRFQLKRQKVENVEWIDWQKCDSEITAEFRSVLFDLLEDEKYFTSVLRAMNEEKNKLPKRKPSKNKSWMTEDILRQLKLRRQMKMRYKITSYVCKKIKAMSNKAQQQNLDEECEKIQKDYFCNPKHAHQRIRKLTGNLRVHNTIKGLKDAYGNTITEEDVVVKRWQEFTKDLNSNSDRPCLPVQFSEPLKGNPIAIDEVAHALRHMKASKAAEPDELTFEMFQAQRRSLAHVNITVQRHIRYR